MSNIEFFGSNNFMVETLFTQWLIPNPTVCSNTSARLNMRTYETNKALRGGIRNRHKPDPTDPFATLVFFIGFVFHGDYYKTLVFSTAATLAGPFAAYIVAERKPGIFPTAVLGLGQVFGCALIADL
jgi:hypothetical protein